MTMTGNSEGAMMEEQDYLDISEFIQNNGADVNNDYWQLWSRNIFNIAISNTDDHFVKSYFPVDCRKVEAIPIIRY
ncbi:MAG: hypothetical protein EOO20_14965 [Chryseobacterium sp.]|nr:MAG: hypothetical protein EOO20_14965 [Chryseobacterium sp.]